MGPERLFVTRSVALLPLPILYLDCVTPQGVGACGIYLDSAASTLDGIQSHLFNVRLTSADYRREVGIRTQLPPMIVGVRTDCAPLNANARLSEPSVIDVHTEFFQLH